MHTENIYDHIYIMNKVDQQVAFLRTLTIALLIILYWLL